MELESEDVARKMDPEKNGGFWKVPRGHLLVDLQNPKNLC